MALRETIQMPQPASAAVTLRIRIGARHALQTIGSIRTGTIRRGLRVAMCSAVLTLPAGSHPVALLPAAPWSPVIDGAANGDPAAARFTAQTARILGSPSPAIEPLAFAPLPADRARMLNAAIPFASSVGAAALPFALRGDAASQSRAADCLAAAMIYEAGSDDLGQRAVAQVVLNRVRHAAFPATVCGVVFQGSDRATGCQFTFTCDGALGRVIDRRRFALAQARAWQMLAGGVVRQVGLATHYHTDWVHPIWSAEMDKLSAIQTHLFFRWHGAWGSDRAFGKPYRGQEPVIAALAGLSDAHRAGALAASPVPMAFDEKAVESTGAALIQNGKANTGAPSGFNLSGSSTKQARVEAIGITMLPGGDGGRQSFQALGRCDGRQVCKVLGHVEDRAEVAFVYIRDRRAKWMEVMLWNCAIFPRTKADECLGPDNRHWIDFEG